MAHQEKFRFLSLGWGVQSWCIAAMSALGELPKLDGAIHSDTGHEQPATYAHAKKWIPWLLERGIPVYTAHPENNEIVRSDWGKRPVIQIPAFTASRTSIKDGQINRQCTRH